MNLRNLFNRKEKQSGFDKELVNYVIQARKLNLKDEDIKRNFRDKNYPEETISKIFTLVNPPIPEKTEPQLLIPKEIKSSPPLNLKKELRKYPRKDRKRFKERWDQWEQGKVLKIEIIKGIKK